MALVKDISGSINEQSSASNTIAQKVEQIAQMAEENASASSASADAAENCSGRPRISCTRSRNTRFKAAHKTPGPASARLAPGFALARKSVSTVLAPRDDWYVIDIQN